MSKFNKIAVIGKYPSFEEVGDFHSQLIQLVGHLSNKNVELIINEDSFTGIDIHSDEDLYMAEMAMRYLNKKNAK